jgi:protein-disulfide isomerase
MSSTENDELTRKQRREAAREERRAAEAQAAAKSQRQKRLVQLGIAVGAAVVVIVVAIVVSSSSSGGPKTSTGITKTPTTLVAQIDNLIGGIPQSGTTLGSPTAPVTMDYYGDLECPICRDFTLQTFPQVVTDLVKTGKMKVVYRSLQTATQDPNVFQQQQVAAYAAGPQNKAWWYIELFYHQQGQEGSNYVNTAFLDNIASQVPGLNKPNWQAAQNDAAIAASVKADQQKAAALGFNSTPTLVLSGPHGTKGTVGLVPYSTVQQLYQSVA